MKKHNKSERKKQLTQLRMMANIGYLCVSYLRKEQNDVIYVQYIHIYISAFI